MISNYQTLTELAEEVQRQEETKQDWLANNERLWMDENDKELVIHTPNTNILHYKVNEHCQRQVAEKLGIPRNYYHKTLAVPGLASYNVNAWLKAQPSNKRFLVRTLDGKARAFLSDKFKPIDNFDVLMHSFFPALNDHKKDIQVKANVLSERRMYIQVVFPSLQAEVKVGDVVQAGIVMRNSEVGAGALDILSL